MSATPPVEERVEALAAELHEHGAAGVPLAFVLGSGLGAFAAALEDPRVIPAAELPSLPKSAVPGHSGRIVLGRLGDRRVLVQEGRVHLYEGWDAREVTLPMRAFAALGVRGVVLTNAAGSLVEEWKPGRAMLVVDHLCLQRRAALFAHEGGLGLPYDPDLGACIERAAQAEGIPLERGVYAAVLGPAYETPAEVRMLRWMGAHAVGMSTASEACAARAAGLRVAAVSCLTNHAAGITTGTLRHEDVVAAGNAAADNLVRLFRAAVPGLAQALEAAGPPARPA